MTTDRMPAGNSIPMARIFNPCPYKTLKRSLLKTSSRFHYHRSATASYIIEIMVKLPAQNVALQSAGSLTCKTNRIIAHNLRLCKMLSLQRAKPFCATAFQPPGKVIIYTV